jgi:sulfur carrier protein
VHLIVNGEHRAVDDGASVADLVTELGGGRARGVAVAVNGDVVPRSAWIVTALHDGDAVEVLTAVQGG